MNRHYSPSTTRFLQDDLYHGALADLGLATDPLTNNRYALAAGHPIYYVETDATWWLRMETVRATSSRPQISGSTDSSREDSADQPDSDDGPGGGLGSIVDSGETVTSFVNETATVTNAVADVAMDEVEDMEEVGSHTFCMSYFLNYAVNRAQGQSHNDAYRHIVWEQRAYYVQAHYQKEDPARILSWAPGF